MVDFLKSNDINCNLYGISLIKNYLDEIIDDMEKCKLFLNGLNSEILIILTSLFNKNNKKLLNELLYILINFAYIEEGEKLFVTDEKILYNIATGLGKIKNDSNLINNGLWLIKNLSTSDEICQILLNYKIVDFFDEIYERYLLDNNFMNNLICILGAFIKYKLDLKISKKSTETPLYLLPSIKIFQTQLRPNLSSDFLKKIVLYLYRFSSFNSDKIYYKMIECTIHKEFMSFYPMIIQQINEHNNKIKEIESNQKNGINANENKQKIEILKTNVENYNMICIIILKTLGKLMSSEDGIITQILIDNGISKFLNYVLETSDLKIIKNAFFCMSNICSGSCGQVNDLFKNNTLIKAINIGKNIYEAINLNSKYDDEYFRMLIDAFRELNYVLSLAIVNSIKDNLIPLSLYDNYTAVILLIKGLNIFAEKECSDLICIILEALYTLSIFDDFKNENQKESLIEVMEKNGTKEYVEKLIKNNNKNYKKYKDSVEKLYNCFLTDFQIENNF